MLCMCNFRKLLCIIDNFINIMYYNTTLRKSKPLTSQVLNWSAMKCLTSGATPQVLESKELILDLLWYDKTYTSENKEVLGLLLVILNDIKSLYTS